MAYTIGHSMLERHPAPKDERDLAALEEQHYLPQTLNKVFSISMLRTRECFRSSPTTENTSCAMERVLTIPRLATGYNRKFGCVPRDDLS